MAEFITERKRAAGFFFVLFMLLSVVFYFYWIKPVKDERASIQRNVDKLEAEIQLLEKELSDIIGDQKPPSIQLAKKMPQSRKIDELIVSLQEIEYVSGSRIQSISFNNYDGTISEGDTQTGDKPHENGDEGIEGEKFVSGIAGDGSLPEGIKLMTVSVSVESPDFQHFHRFLTEMEQLDRIAVVDVLSFAQPAERELFYDEMEDPFIFFDLTFTTFYYEEPGLR